MSTSDTPAIPAWLAKVERFVFAVGEVWPARRDYGGEWQHQWVRLADVVAAAQEGPEGWKADYAEELKLREAAEADREVLQVQIARALDLLKQNPAGWNRWTAGAANVLDGKPSSFDGEVPDMPAPTATLCWKQARTMERCDREAGHAGLHTWEQPDLTALRAAVADWLRDGNTYGAGHRIITAARAICGEKP